MLDIDTTSYYLSTSAVEVFFKGKKSEKKVCVNFFVREKTEAGSPLLSLVDQGIERPKFVSDVIVALLEELR